MVGETAAAHLRYILEQQGERVRKPKSTVLFRRGDKASGMFDVLSGKLSLDLGVDSALSTSHGAGALAGLPSIIPGQNYSVPPTVTEDAELGFWRPEAWNLCCVSSLICASHSCNSEHQDREES